MLLEKAQECNPNSIKKLFIDPSEKIEIEDLKALANSIKIPINSIDKFLIEKNDSDGLVDFFSEVKNARDKSILKKED